MLHRLNKLSSAWTLMFFWLLWYHQNTDSYAVVFLSSILLLGICFLYFHFITYYNRTVNSTVSCSICSFSYTWFENYEVANCRIELLAYVCICNKKRSLMLILHNWSSVLETVYGVRISVWSVVEGWTTIVTTIVIQDNK